MAVSVSRVLTFALAMLCASTATAQDQNQPAESPDVVVNGIRDTAREVREFVGALSTGATERQLSRFETRQVCPAAIGLGPDQKAVVVARLRQVAAAAGVPLAKAKCRPNVMVIITRDKKALLQSLQKENGDYFTSLTKEEVRRLLDDPSPAAAWHLGGTLNADGVEMQRPGGDQVAVNRTFTAGSRVTLASRPQFVAAAVVVQADALVGLTITQLADYAAMRTLAQIDPAALAKSSAPTILTVLDAGIGSEVPVTLTRWDMDLLKGLYGSISNLSAAAERSRIAATLGKDAAARARKDE